MLSLAKTFEQARDLIEQQLSLRADLAVTGMSRSGKTVFITSLIHNLASARRNGAVLPALAAASEGRLVGVEERPDPAADVERFPTQAHLRALAADAPHWPKPTAAVSRTELVIRYQRTSWLTRWLQPEGTLHLGLIDYPGEWLLDLPMLTQSYAEWSRATLELLREAPRAALARDFLEFLADVDPSGPPDEETAHKGHALYRAALLAFRDRAGLSFLQPGRFVMPDGKGDRPLLWFFPIDPPADGNLRRRSLAGLLAERYDTYGAKVVTPFFAETFGRTNRQVVLVDLLSALNKGRHAFEDTCLALDAALDALQVRRSGLLGRLLPRRFDKVLFAATKADHVPDIQRDRLGELLASITGVQADRARVAGAKETTLALAAARSTEDAKVRLEIGEVDVVVGIPVGQAPRVKVYPGTIPRTPPPPAFWEGREVAFPQFQPPPITMVAGQGIPHINLDVALQFLLEDLLA